MKTPSQHSHKLDWNTQSLGAGLIAAADRPDFYARMANLVKQSMVTSGISAYILNRSASPQMRLQTVRPSAIRKRTVPLNAFQSWAYALDPLYQAFISGESAGAFTLGELSPDGFENTDFFDEFYTKAYASDEVNVLAPLSKKRAIAIYFVRDPKEGRYSKGEIAAIKALSPLLIESARLHERMRTQAVSPAAFSDQWNKALATFGRSSLTHREHQILQFTLIGKSAQDTADLLGLALGTVKNHRKAVYRKLGVERFGDLFAMFLRTAGHADGAVDPLEICPASLMRTDIIL